MNAKRNVQRIEGILDSWLTRSTGIGVLMAWPQEDRAPLMDKIEDCSREKPRQQCSQQRVLL